MRQFSRQAELAAAQLKDADEAARQAGEAENTAQEQAAEAEAEAESEEQFATEEWLASLNDPEQQKEWEEAIAKQLSSL
ncbi:hypothetical protein SVIOM342S_06880 [Streptomyces violaceorubidus]